ncbi:MAG TPA: DUF1552 domain-containing protein [Polyangia bacterium]|jgi:hypothetical protein|nr:DUF1552 domain-containing protein [Polyangia bacterium]
MRFLVWSFVVSLVVCAAACGKRPISEKDGGVGGSIAAGAGGRGGASGSGAGAGARGAGIAGSNGGGAIAGSSGGGGATAGSNGGAGAGANGGANANAGTSGGSAGTGGASAGTGGAIAGTGGASAGTGGATAGTGGGNAGNGPLRLFIFYTRWGTSYPEWWPTGSDRSFTMSAMLQALEPYKSELIVVSGLTNANLPTGGGDITLATANDVMGDAMLTLLTARRAALGGPADGPSLDTAVGNCGGAAGPPLRLTVGQFGFDDNPGISFADDATPLRGERDPRAAAMRVLGHDVTAPDPNGDISAIYPALGTAHMNVAVEALATAKACVVTLMWGDHVNPTWLGLNATDVHELSHDTIDLYDAVNSKNAPSGNRFVKMQSWYAQQFASLLGQLRSTPLGAGTLLDQSVVVWISESGAGVDHSGAYVPIVIAGGGGGRLDVGRFIEIKPHVAMGLPVQTWAIDRTQGDLLQALANLWGMPYFGDVRIARQTLTQILKN